MRFLTVLTAVSLVSACAVLCYWQPAQPLIQTGLRMMQPARGLTLPYAPPPAAELWRSMPPGERLANVRSRLMPKLTEELAAQGLRLGQPAHLRIFKESSELEVWMCDKAAVWKRFRTYPIACYSGKLGPKTKEGDFQAPEGFYSVSRKQLNPASNYHLAFNLGYPNAYDLQHKRTGSFIMVHGDECSVGCFAMTDPLIEEIYTVVEAALDSGSPTVHVHIFPFRMTAERLKQAESAETPHFQFWRELEPAYAYFQEHTKPPRVNVKEGRYHVQP